MEFVVISARTRTVLTIGAGKLDESVPKLFVLTGCPKIDGPLRGLRIAHVHIVLCGKTVTSDFYVEEVLNQTGAVKAVLDSAGPGR